MKLTDAQKKKEIAGYVKKWRQKLFLGEWHVYTHLKKSQSEQHPRRAAEVYVDHEYMQASIHIFPGFWDHGKIDRERFLVHELCHCVAEELYACVDSLMNDEIVTRKHSLIALERLVQRISNIAFQGGLG